MVTDDTRPLSSELGGEHETRRDAGASEASDGGPEVEGRLPATAHTAATGDPEAPAASSAPEATASTDATATTATTASTADPYATPVTYRKGPAPFAVFVGLVGLLVAGGVLIQEIADVSVPWGDLGPWSVVAGGLVVVLVGVLGLRANRGGD